MVQCELSWSVMKGRFDFWAEGSVFHVGMDGPYGSTIAAARPMRFCFLTADFQSSKRRQQARLFCMRS